jgi:glucosamine--fructose-6-phosphate aminotransferase (isomerizing)
VSFAADEIRSQPEVWRRAVALSREVADAMPAPGARVLILGCGTSAFVAQSMAYLRELGGLGDTDWAFASELPPARRYDHVIAVSRSGTTTEVVQALESLPSTTVRTAITADLDSPVVARCERVVDLSFADELSVVQTRFPSSLLVLWRALIGHPIDRVVSDAERVLAGPLGADVDQYDHFVFLGRGWTIGLAHEAALKMRESAQAWSESHPALDYRHGPISAAHDQSLVVSLGGVDGDLLDDVRATGATVIDPDLDPLARLVVCQRLAVAAGEARGLDVDRPRHLSRSVILEPGT